MSWVNLVNPIDRGCSVLFSTKLMMRYDDVMMTLRFHPAVDLSLVPTGHPQIYLAVLHSCKVESGGGLGTKLMRPFTSVLTRFYTALRMKVRDGLFCCRTNSTECIVVVVHM